MNKFQSECKKTIASISNEDIKKFNASKNHQSRIRAIYEYVKVSENELKRPVKNFNVAETEKLKGNSFFARKDYKNAIKSYNDGIVNCPQYDDTSNELLAILVANRSAAFFEMQEFRKVLNDIDYVLEIDKYPKCLLYKIWLRKAKCYEALQNENSAKDLYQQAFEYLKYSQMNSDQISSKIENIKRRIGEMKKMKQNPMETAKVYGDESYIPNRSFVAAHIDILFDHDDCQGKFARAAKDIPAGQIIIQENPHCFVLSPENNLTNCQHCLISTNQIFPCQKCTSVIFCSRNCEITANESYHKYECVFQNFLFEAGVSINCALALRLISQRNPKFFIEMRSKFDKYLEDNSGQDITVDPYDSKNYQTVFFLCRNESSRNKEELLHLAIMSIFLYKLLKNSNFFEERTGEELTENQVFIVSLILRHLEMLQFNCHEIAELRGTLKEDREDKSFGMHCIGAGIYPTAALFNHSCDPSVIRYNLRKKLVVRTIKPIKKGEIIYENYGPMYTTMKREYRQRFLKERYRFDCVCAPCHEFWPLLDKMDEQEMRIECKNCYNIFLISKSTMQPLLICNWCGRRETLFPVLKNLMILENILSNAEYFYKNGQFTNAISLFLQALNILYDNLKPPCPDMIKIQQRLRTCFVHYGNKRIDYE